MNTYKQEDYTKTVTLLQVIVTNIERRGTGEKNSPIRIIREIWTTDGEKIGEYDPQP